LELGLPVFQPKSVNTNDFYEKVVETAPDYIVVAAFGQIFSEKLLSIPKKHSINVHASLLPKYRGAAPIHWALINGENETGITTMLMAKKMDAGDILLLPQPILKTLIISELFMTAWLTWCKPSRGNFRQN
jgi:methionyl-tRNA formyltransferase